MCRGVACVKNNKILQAFPLHLFYSLLDSGHIETKPILMYCKEYWLHSAKSYNKRRKLSIHFVCRLCSYKCARVYGVVLCHYASILNFKVQPTLIHHCMNFDKAYCCPVLCFSIHLNSHSCAGFSQRSCSTQNWTHIFAPQGPFCPLCLCHTHTLLLWIACAVLTFPCICSLLLSLRVNKEF